MIGLSIIALLILRTLTTMTTMEIVMVAMMMMMMMVMNLIIKLFLKKEKKQQVCVFAIQFSLSLSM